MYVDDIKRVLSEKGKQFAQKQRIIHRSPTQTTHLYALFPHSFRIDIMP